MQVYLCTYEIGNKRSILRVIKLLYIIKKESFYLNSFVQKKGLLYLCVGFLSKIPDWYVLAWQLSLADVVQFGTILGGLKITKITAVKNLISMIVNWDIVSQIFLLITFIMMFTVHNTI